MDSDEERQERMVPVQGRVDIVSLAEMLMYFEGNDLRVRSMSALISWCVEVAHQILNNNGALKDRCSSVGDAHQVLTSYNIYQRSTLDRGRKKIAHAIMFENMRAEGIDPKTDAPTQYKVLHNLKSVEPMPGRIGGSRMANLVSQAMKIMENDGYGDKAKRLKKKDEDRLNALREMGG
jgi:hypothetical protein